MSILNELKQQTQVYHDKLEQNYYARKILTNSITMPIYGAMLQKYWGFHAPLESQIEQHPAWQTIQFDIESRHKAPLLQQDLQYLGLLPTDTPLPQCSDLPQLDSFAQVLGTLYVLEGATLGGQVVLRHVHQTLNIDPQTGGAYFNSYGRQVGAKWQAFRKLVTDYVATATPNKTELIDAACQTFIKFDHWLTPP